MRRRPRSEAPIPDRLVERPARDNRALALGSVHESAADECARTGGLIPVSAADGSKSPDTEFGSELFPPPPIVAPATG